MPDRLGVVLFLLKCGELLSALGILALAFALPRQLFVAVNLFGAFVALRTIIILIYGLKTGRMLYSKRSIVRSDQPVKFWLLCAVNLLVFVAGIGLTQLPYPDSRL